MSISQILNDFESFLISQAPQIPSFHPHYEQAVWEMMKNGGKRFRPALVFCVVNALAPQLIKNAFLPALSIECIHTYSLIHDDLPCMDNAPLRRGHATLHTKYDETPRCTGAMGIMGSERSERLGACKRMDVTFVLAVGFGRYYAANGHVRSRVPSRRHRTQGQYLQTA